MQFQHMCAICGRAEAETVVNMRSHRGFWIIAFQHWTQTLVGCVSCVRRELLRDSGMTFVSILFSPFVLVPIVVFDWVRVIRLLTLGPNPRAIERYYAAR